MPMNFNLRYITRVVLDSYFRANSTLDSCDNPDDSTLTQLNTLLFLIDSNPTQLKSQSCLPDSTPIQLTWARVESNLLTTHHILPNLAKNVDWGGESTVECT